MKRIIPILLEENHGHPKKPKQPVKKKPLKADYRGATPKQVGPC